MARYDQQRRRAAACGRVYEHRLDGLPIVSVVGVLDDQARGMELDAPVGVELGPDLVDLCGRRASGCQHGDERELEVKHAGLPNR
jgi:hypothetical protein